MLRARGRDFPAALLAAAALFASRTAGAEAFTSYEVAEGCPSREQATGRLAAHLDGNLPGPPRAPTLSLRASRISDGSFVGALETVEAGGGGATQRRELADPACADLVWALVFIAALSISPDARPLPPSAGAPTPEEPSVVPHVVDRAEPGGPPPRPATVSPSTKALEVGPEARVGPFPTLALGLAARGSLGIFALGLSAVTGTEAARLVEGDARFWMATARPHVCPLTVGRSFRIEGCAGADVGVVNAASAGLDGARSVLAFWVAAEAAIRGRLDRGALFVALEVRASVPFHRPTYITSSPRSEVYEVPLLTGAAGLYGGLSW